MNTEVTKSALTHEGRKCIRLTMGEFYVDCVEDAYNEVTHEIMLDNLVGGATHKRFPGWTEQMIEWSAENPGIVPLPTREIQLKKLKSAF